MKKSSLSWIKCQRLGQSFGVFGLLLAQVLPPTLQAQDNPPTPNAQPSSAPSTSKDPHWGGQGMPPGTQQLKEAKKSSKKKPPEVSIPAELQEVEAKYSKAGTIEAHFEQTTESANLKQKKHTTGVIQLKIPDKIRWETLTPDKNLLISDGKHFWFYTPPFDQDEDGQLIEKKGSDVRSKLANALMAGSFSTAKRKNGLKITQTSPGHYNLLPKKGSAGTVALVKIEIDPLEKSINKVILFHSDGNMAEIKLTQIQFGKPMDDSLFTFTPPPHTQIVKE